MVGRRRAWQLAWSVAVLAVTAGTAWFIVAVSLPVRRNTALALAARKGDLREVRRLLDAGADPNALVECGEEEEGIRRTWERVRYGYRRDAKPALLWAMEEDSAPTPAPNASPGHPVNEQVVRILLEHGADPRRGDGYSTPLGSAAQCGSPAVVRMLVAAGAPVDMRCGSRLTALAWSGTPDVAETLISLGADVNRDAGEGPPLLKAITSNNDAVAHVLLRHGASARARELLPEAALIGRADLVRELLARGADPLHPAGEGERALVSAADVGSLEVTVMLLRRGVDPNTPTQRTTALTRAAAMERADVAEALLRRGADPNRRGANGDSPLSAQMSRSPKMIALLRRAGAK